MTIGVSQELAISQRLCLIVGNDRWDDDDEKCRNGQHNPDKARIGLAIFHEGILGLGLFACGFWIWHAPMLGAGCYALVIALDGQGGDH